MSSEAIQKHTEPVKQQKYNRTVSQIWLPSQPVDFIDVHAWHSFINTKQ